MERSDGLFMGEIKFANLFLRIDLFFAKTQAGFSVHKKLMIIIT